MRPEQINAGFLWPKASELGVQQQGKPLFKEDRLLSGLEDLISQKKAWAPISGSTKRTEPSDKLKNWINAQGRQKTLLNRKTNISFNIDLDLNDFPLIPDRPGNRVISTSRNIAYLVDKCSDLLSVLEKSFGTNCRHKAATVLFTELGVFVYVSNSVESGGRAFSGDPFTGQAAAYSRIFAHDMFGKRVLNFVAYFPHQLYSQFFTQTGDVPKNKGVKMHSSQSTLIITCGGILIEPGQWKIIQ
jgi:hypothetical protein